MEFIIGLGLLLLLLATIFLPWINRGEIAMLSEEIKELKKKMLRLENDIRKMHADAASSEEERLNEAESNAPVNIPTAIPEQSLVEEEHASDKIPQYDEPEPHRPEPEHSPTKPFNFEEQFGAKLPVWIGGVALALAAFYLVKYSIDNNLLSPFVRVILGGGAGITAILAANWIREKDKFGNGKTIAQSLTGAGIAALYVSTFAATSLYGLLPEVVGLGAMIVITALAVILSLRHGAPIALLGLVGGFITPGLLSFNSDIPTPILFLYLYIIFAGLMAVIRQKRWWGLSLPAIIGAFLWVVFWILDGFTPNETIWVGLFLFAVSATIVAGSHQDTEKTTSFADISWSRCNILNYLGLCGSVLLMGTITAQAGFGFIEWGLFGALAVGGIVLAYFKSSVYGFVPWVLMAVNAVMIAAWDAPHLNDFTCIVTAFAALYIGCAYLIAWKSNLPSRWVGLMGATSVGYYLLAYFKLQQTTAFDGAAFLWGGLALGLATLFIIVTKKAITTLEKSASETHNVLGITSLMATLFITLALIIELDREFLSIAVAAEVLAVAWVATRIPIKALRSIALLLSLVFGFLLVPQILLLLQLTAFSLVEVKLSLQKTVPIVDWPLFQLGVPAVMFIGASYYLRAERDGRLVRGLELASIALVAVMGYYLNRHAFHVPDDIMFKQAGFFERNIMTNILFIYGIACFYAGRIFERIAFSWAAIGLCCVALFRVVYFDVFMHNPLWSHQDIRGVFIANELLLPFGLPLLWLFFATKELGIMGQQNVRKYVGGFYLLLIFAWLSLNVRFVFHAPDLSVGSMSNAETYAYSVAWLILGIALLFTGVLKKDKMIRYASLVIMILTVGKVFLYDASELEGLYRVFSFFGLGLSLLGLSYFYTRFVFKESER